MFRERCLTAKGYPFEVTLPVEGKIGGVVLSDQIRSLDWRARKVEFAGKAPERVVREVLHKLDAIIQPA